MNWGIIVELQLKYKKQHTLYNLEVIAESNAYKCTIDYHYSKYGNLHCIFACLFEIIDEVIQAIDKVECLKVRLEISSNLQVISN